MRRELHLHLLQGRKHPRQSKMTTTTTMTTMTMTTTTKKKNINKEWFLSKSQLNFSHKNIRPYGATAFHSEVVQKATAVRRQTRQPRLHPCRADSKMTRNGDSRTNGSGRMATLLPPGPFPQATRNFWNRPLDVSARESARVNNVREHTVFEDCDCKCPPEMMMMIRIHRTTRMENSRNSTRMKWNHRRSLLDRSLPRRVEERHKNVPR
mmetsp:Transcript_18923/g.44024  ORF Transcript_18923/g.44024 Transcript_18923/m.44024 type:complete len:209 (-) Transcript_18923:1012-1638(-)